MSTAPLRRSTNSCRLVDRRHGHWVVGWPADVSGNSTCLACWWRSGSTRSEPRTPRQLLPALGGGSLLFRVELSWESACSHPIPAVTDAIVGPVTSPSHAETVTAHASPSTLPVTKHVAIAPTCAAAASNSATAPTTSCGVTDSAGCGSTAGLVWGRLAKCRACSSCSSPRDSWLAQLQRHHRRISRPQAVLLRLSPPLRSTRLPC